TIDELIINLAPTGMVPTRAETPHVPLTPAEVAADVRRCADLGAAIVHVHPRDEKGQPSQTVERAREYFEAIRAAAPDVILCTTTSGRVVSDLEPRAAVLAIEGVARPEMASLTLGSMNFPKQASINSPDTIRGLATAMAERGILPEWEIFDLGMLDFAHYLRGHGLLGDPVYVNILLGSLGTLAATPLNLALAVERLPDGATWAATGVGRFQFAVQKWAIAMGGHVRVGLEDNVWFDDHRTDLATNPRLVERLVAIGRASGREPASPAQVRELLGISARR
ncbi:MAG TPA: 3-keto-5-aminohexanoate cleavage protein, partial [Candidatus Limnocylindrales bacterium]|nr:3-keto-5-aminohexanoate cleavage protein [Candidatus Limnocylindrales bacterium]